MYRAFPEDYDKTLYKAHTEVLFKGLLLHLDDPSPPLQVGEVVMWWGRCNNNGACVIIGSSFGCFEDYHPTEWCHDEGAS